MKKYIYIIIGLIILNILIIGAKFTYSSFYSTITGKTEDLTFAKINFNHEKSTKVSFSLGNLNPGEEKDYKFKVANYKDGSGSDINIGYQLTIETYHFIPTTIQLYKKNEQICNLENTDLYIGSDQVWNFDIIKNDLTYFGEFKNTTPKNIFSYAASIGNSKISQKNKDKIIKLLKNFQKISIREESARKMLDESPKIDVVLDPTLLLSKNEWEKALNLNTVQNKPYIFLYTLEARSETLKCAQNLSKKLNLPIIEISGKRKSLKRLEKHKIFYDASPYQFVKLLSNASFVITESFHATSLSIIFEKKFITTIHKTRGSRISDLLNKVNLIERYSNEVTDSLINDKIDYKNVKKLIAKYQRESLNYIKECVKK